MQQPASFVTFRPFLMPVLLLIFTTIYLNDALSSGRLVRYGLPGPSFMPVVLSVAMYMGLAFVIAREAIGMARAARDAEPPKTSNVSFAPLWIAAATLGLILLLKPLGFLITAILYVFAILSAFAGGGTARRIAIRAALSIVIAGLVYLFFTTFFAVKLPPGVLF